jgi:hypothetical protein
MISCTEFIPAYSELFKYLDDRGGHVEVEKFWAYLSDKFLDNLRELAAAKGLRGCWEYWSHTLNEEAADFEMVLDEEQGFFSITMHNCPSKGRLLQLKHVKPYYDYCGHCDLLYRRVLDPLGFEYEYDMSRTDKAACSLIIRQKRDQQQL